MDGTGAFRMIGRRVGFMALAAALGGVALASGGFTVPKLSPKPSRPLPVLVFSSPADESSVSAVVPVRAVADQDAVQTVTFYLDGVELARAKGPGGSFKWDTTRAGDGWHTLSAVAKDSEGRQTESKLAVMVKNFKDDEAPKVALVWPTDASPKKGWMTVPTVTQDNIGVTLVEAYVDGKRVASSTSAPFDLRWSWKKLSKGSHSIQVKAYDASGNVGTSAPVTFMK